jgi:glycosyltransferase involved in cell wall biosynthesis
MPDELRVTFLLPYGGFGGGARAIMRFANALKDQGNEARILARKSDLSLKDKLREGYLNKVYGNKDWLQYSEVPVASYSSLRDFSFARDELVVAMCTQTSFDLMELDPGSCIPVYHCHGAEIEHWEPMIKAWHLPTRKISVSSRLCRAISEETGQKCYGVAPDGVDTNEYFPSVPENARKAVGAGFRWRYSKDPWNTIRVFDVLRSRLRGTPQISFGTGKRPKGLEKVSYSRLPDVEQARGLYSRCRVWFLTSIEEGFGLPVLEAMACGCAVVATDSGGPSDIIKNGENGFLVEVGNYGAMAYRAAQIFEDDALYARLREGGLETARRYSWEAAGAILEGKLSEIRADARSE